MAEEQPPPPPPPPPGPPIVRAKVGSSQTFHGRQDEDGSLWLWQLERNIRLGACTNEQRLDFAIMHLDGMALRWCRSHNYENWANFYLGFRDRFCQEDRDAILYRLQNLKQGEGQSARWIADQVLTLCGQLPHIDGYQRKNYFLSALNARTRELVTVRMPATLEEAEAVATALERLESQNGPLSIMTPPANIPQPVSVPPAPTQRAEPRSPMDDLLGEFQKMRLELTQLKEATNKQATYRPRLPLRCHACGEEGHVVRDCPRNQQGPEGGNNRPPAPNRPVNRGMNLAQYQDDTDQGMQAVAVAVEEDTRSEVQRFLEDQYGQPQGDPQLVTRGVRDDGERGQARKRPHLNPGWDVDDAGPQVPELPPRYVPRAPRARAVGANQLGGCIM